jgi:hypothetical protein
MHFLPDALDPILVTVSATLLCSLQLNSLFLCHIQLTRVGKDHCVEIINHCEPTVEGKKKKCMGIDGELSVNNTHLYMYSIERLRYTIVPIY